MEMEINSIYNSYAGSYTNSANSIQQATEETAQTNSTAGKTAADELSYLSSKYSNYSFLGANYTKGMQYGSSSTVNVAISPQFLAKMANDPKLEAEYEGYIADMRELDAQEDRSQAAKGWHVAARGWVIDKDGGISKWGIVQKDNKKSYLQTMSEDAEKIRGRNAEKKKAQKEIEQKRRADREEKPHLKEKAAAGGNLDIKV